MWAALACGRQPPCPAPLAWMYLFEELKVNGILPEGLQGSWLLSQKSLFAECHRLSLEGHCLLRCFPHFQTFTLETTTHHRGLPLIPLIELTEGNLCSHTYAHPTAEASATRFCSPTFSSLICSPLGPGASRWLLTGLQISASL